MSAEHSSYSPTNISTSSSCIQAVYVSTISSRYAFDFFALVRHWTAGSQFFEGSGAAVAAAAAATANSVKGDSHGGCIRYSFVGWLVGRLVCWLAQRATTTTNDDDDNEYEGVTDGLTRRDPPSTLEVQTLRCTPEHNFMSFAHFCIVHITALLA